METLVRKAAAIVPAESSSIHLGIALTTRECQDTRHKRVEMQAGRLQDHWASFQPSPFLFHWLLQLIYKSFLH